MLNWCLLVIYLVLREFHFCRNFKIKLNYGDLTTIIVTDIRKETRP